MAQRIYHDEPTAINLRGGIICELWAHKNWTIKWGYKDGLQPESLADGNWLVKQNQPVSKIETNSDTILRSLYES